MKRNWKRNLAALICLCVLAVASLSSVTAQAKVPETAQPYMVYISNYGAELSISSKGVASVTGFVNGKSGVTSTYVKVVLEKQNGSAWEEVETWEASGSSKYLAVAETYDVSRGTYRVVATVKANTESKTANSDILKTST